jgi:Nif-specific regulatory protein
MSNEAGEGDGGERAFERGLLSLTAHRDLRTLLDQAVELLATRTKAREAYVEVIGGDEGYPETSYVASRGCGDVRLDRIRGMVSRGIIAQAIASGQTVVTASAVDDPRFSNLESVQRLRVESVLCAPLGREDPLGIVYLQGPGGSADATTFGDDTRAAVELFAQLLAPLARQLLGEQGMLPVVAARTPAGEGDAFRDVIGRSSALLDVLERLRSAAPLDIHVLLTGPSGTGKTLLAQGVHRASKRSAGPFLEINCATISEGLLENELFGAEPGAHSTVPRTGLKGKVEVAEGGTLFLDEIGELSLGAQAKLLQFLQSKTYLKLAGTTPRRADTRIIAATNVNLKAAVAERRFREDLYFRLKVLEVRVPSLAERSEDIVLLGTHFVHQASARHDLPVKALAPSAIRAIRLTPWPGNVRELANRIESAAVHAHLRGGDRVEHRDLFPDEPSDSEQPLTLQAATRAFHRRHLLSVLESTDWDIAEAVRVLDISRSHIYGLIRSLELKRA